MTGMLSNSRPRAVECREGREGDARHLEAHRSEITPSSKISMIWRHVIRRETDTRNSLQNVTNVIANIWRFASFGAKNVFHARRDSGISLSRHDDAWRVPSLRSARHGVRRGRRVRGEAHASALLRRDPLSRSWRASARERPPSRHGFCRRQRRRLRWQRHLLRRRSLLPRRRLPLRRSLPLLLRRRTH